ncbi:hypothetical protein CY35_18G008200 [Sphagnum magellanicum]|nr:hypothetical protein CY35_18G008100 [Sphagnum magellanicum]KAH9532622.1 hypothetical protein CY35_18G008200 [Sphagnum magellanicum]
MAFRPHHLPSYLSGPSPARTINVTVAQSGNADHFSIVEETTLNQGIWSRTDDSNFTLTITGTDASGILRFKGSGHFEGTFILVVVGVENSVPWLDLKASTNAFDTGASIHQRYYNSNAEESVKRSDPYTSASIPASDTTPEITARYYTDDRNLNENAKRRGVIVTIT